MNPISRAAGNLSNTALFDPVDLGDGTRGTVPRRRTVSGSGVIVKSLSGGAEGPELFRV